MPDMALFRKAEEWLNSNRTFLLEQTYKAPSVYVLVNATDLNYALAKDYDKAAVAYKKRFGPTPPEGRHFVGQQLKRVAA
ncbi:MAG: hypothetical protein KGI70_00785 [Patescibacteria group bacterium]|nr:hypothetical protein [Patescibacteria group bacterium]